MSFDIVSLAVGTTLGLGGGVALSFMTYRLGAKRLFRGDATFIAIDPEERSIDIVPMEYVGENIYISRDGRYYGLVPSKVRKVFFRPFRSAVYIGFRIGREIVAKNPEILVTLGIAKLGIQSELWESTDPEAFDRLIQFLREKAKEYRGEIPVSSEVSLIIVYDTARIVRAMELNYVDVMKYVLRAILQTSEQSKAMERLAGKSSGWEGFGRFLVWLGIFFVIVVIALGLRTMLGGAHP